MSAKRHWKGLFLGGAFLALCFTGPTVQAQMTDATGMLQPQAFLAYGPFGPAVGQIPCDTTTADLLVNFISPEAITCFTPEEGDEPGWDGMWDPASLTAGAYYGPVGLGGDPVVRAYGGVLPDLDSEFGGDDRAQWMITYIEYDGGGPINAEFCIESDDGVLMFVDGLMVWENQVCRAIPDQCTAEVVPVTLEPGAHVIATSAFDRGGGWQLRMTLQVAGVPVVDGVDPDWIFHGTDRPPEGDFAAGVFPCEDPPVIIPIIPEVTCELNAENGADVTWTLPPDLSTLTDTIEVSLNGVVIDTVDADTSSYTIDAAELEGLSLASICVQPVGSSRPTCCGIQLGDEVYINCGGPTFIDTLGRVWSEDTSANPSPFLTSPPTNVDGPQVIPDVSLDQNIVDNLFPGDVFQYERWSNGPVEYTVPGLDDGKIYDVHLLFKEHCCSDGCLDGDPVADPCDYVSEDELPPAFDPQTVSSSCRIFNVLINDDFVRQQWSKSLWAACLSGSAPGAPSYNIGVSILAEEIQPVDEAIKILIEDLGDGNPPENASIKGIAIVESGTVVVEPIPEVNCVINDAGGVDVSWTLPAGNTAEIEVSVQGSVIETVSSTTTSTTVPAAELAGLDLADICVRPIGSGPTCCTVFLGGSLYINCGGDELTDTEGRIWTRDTLAEPSPFLTSPNTNTDPAQNAVLPDLSFDQNIIDNMIPGEIFEAERWSNGPVEYTIAGFDDSKLYNVHFFFKEHCCSDGCLDGDPGVDPCDAVPVDENPPLVDPQFVSSACRVFDIYINDELVRDQFSKNLLAACLSGNVPGAPSNHIAVSVLEEDVQSVDGTIKILIDDLGDTNPPENASIKGLAIIQSGDEPPPRDEFVRGDADALGGAPNITDGIFVLNFLFLGGPPPPCENSADSDDSGVINITDGIYILNFLFLGGPAPPTPYPDCGEDTTTSPLTCASFPSC